jgi:hypothetical protein
MKNNKISRKKYKKYIINKQINKSKKSKKSKKMINHKKNNKKKSIKKGGDDETTVAPTQPAPTQPAPTEETNTEKFKDISNNNKIHTTENESIFEAYLAVLTTILGTQHIYKLISNTMPVYAVETKYKDSPTMYPTIANIIKKDNDTIENENKFNKCIFYYGDKNEKGEIVPTETHYRVLIKGSKIGRNKTPIIIWEILDPYHLYQISGSHGFCQMFAYFISIEDTDDLKKIETAKNDRNEKFNIYRFDTFQCLQKTLSLIDKRRSELIGDIEKEFNDLKKEDIALLKKKKKEKWGIGKEMTIEDFLTQLKEFKEEDLNEYIEYWFKIKK